MVVYRILDMEVFVYGVIRCILYNIYNISYHIISYDMILYDMIVNCMMILYDRTLCIIILYYILINVYYMCNVHTHHR